MGADDIKWMGEAIEWAVECNPIKDSIPTVGAVIEIGNKPLGRGRRGSGDEGDDDHAEQDALKKVADVTQL
ncbi:MAG: hypothetical protein ACLQSR_07960 [Limisphaerales bacterium]